MENRNAPPGDWNDCPTGQISGMLRNIERGRRHAVVRHGAIGVAILVVAIFVPQLIPSDAPPPLFGGVCCEDVQENARAWLAGDVTPGLREQITEHLKECPHCPKLIEQLRLENDQTAVTVPNRYLLASSSR